MSPSADMKIPIIGPEEQAADYLAVLTLLRPLVERPQATETWLRFALTTADAFVILWQAAEKAGSAAPYWDSHGLSIQRYYGITCLIYGSDRQRFASLPALAQMPPQQSANCEAEYARASESLDWLVAFASDARRSSTKPSMSVNTNASRPEPASTLSPSCGRASLSSGPWSVSASWSL